MACIWMVASVNCCGTTALVQRIVEGQLLPLRRCRAAARAGHQASHMVLSPVGAASGRLSPRLSATQHFAKLAGG